MGKPHFFGAYENLVEGVKLRMTCRRLVRVFIRRPVNRDTVRQSNIISNVKTTKVSESAHFTLAYEYKGPQHAPQTQSYLSLKRTTVPTNFNIMDHHPEHSSMGLDDQAGECLPHRSFVVTQSISRQKELFVTQKIAWSGREPFHSRAGCVPSKE
jgi:hypothetical protein